LGLALAAKRSGLFYNWFFLNCIWPRRLQWPGHACQIGETKMAVEFWMRKVLGTDHFEMIQGCGRIILKWISGKLLLIA
jgi:hypothetical protein